MKSKLIRVLLALLLAATLSFSCALGEIAWPAATTAGQQALIDYIAQVNANLQTLGAGQINSLFDYGVSTVVLGVTAVEDAEIPESVEITVQLYDNTLNTLELRCSDASRFTNLAAACIQAASPDTITLADASKTPAQYARKAMANASNSFADEVQPLNGPSARTYYAYYPNQYHNGVNWLQMTLVFPLVGYDEAGVYATPALNTDNGNVEYEGYQPTDDLTHFEVFTTATPEPDSPAGEEKP